MKRLLILSAFSFMFLSVTAQNRVLPKINAEAKIDALIKSLTLEEKVSMIHANSSFTTPGIPRLGIPGFIMSDGPHGVRPELGTDYVLDNNIADSGTYLPVGVCLASTWNPSLGYQFGSTLGREAAGRGKNVILGPGINIIRSPLNGRNFEYQSEDPYLVSKMVVGYIKGVQDQGVSACVKHYAANNQERWRTWINVEMSERALREIYLPGFKAAIQEGGVHTLMGSYNKFRGEWATHNQYLMNQILKKEWGFKGVVMSDWNAVHRYLEPMWYGTDLEMGTDLSQGGNVNYNKFFMADSVIALVKSGRLSEYYIDEKVRRILWVMSQNGMLDKKPQNAAYNSSQNQQAALKIAEEGIVLLKNENNTLPLNSGSLKRIAVIGVNAARTQSMGGGSSQVRAFYEVTPLQGIQKLVGSGATITYEPGYNISRGAGADAGAIARAVTAATAADVVILVGGWTHGFDYNVWTDNAYDAEDADKPDMKLPFGQDELFRAVIAANPRTVVVLYGGGPVDMNKWVGNARAVVQAWYPGMEGGNALAKILFGQVNPSGKLPMTFPKVLEDVPAHKLGQYPGDSIEVVYMDDIYVGYRYHDTYKVAPQFAFGHGLSYTTFTYSNLKVTSAGKGATVSFTVRNSGGRAGAEVAQVYVGQVQSTLPRPLKELKGFEKVSLQPGQSKTITISLNEDAFKYFNDVKHEWVKEKGVYKIMVGSSSADIRLNGSVRM